MNKTPTIDELNAGDTIMYDGEVVEVIDVGTHVEAFGGDDVSHVRLPYLDGSGDYSLHERLYNRWANDSEKRFGPVEYYFIPGEPRP